MISAFLRWTAGTALLWAVAAGAQQAAPDEEQLVIERLAAVIGLEATVPASARSAPALGTERQGSGVVIDGNGLVATVGYLILEATAVELVLNDSRRVEADVVGYDHDSGLGLVRAREPLDITPMPLGDSGPLAQRQPLLVSSYGGLGAVQPVMVVSRREFTGYWEYLLEDAVFTSPPHPAFGGAALLGPDGSLLGIGSLVVGDALPGSSPLPGNMFIPVNHLKSVLPDLLTEGRASGPRRPWLGVYADYVAGRGLVIGRLADGGPAERAGLAVQDVLIAVENEPVTSMSDFYRKIWASGEAGNKVQLTLFRGEQIQQVEVETMDRYDWLRLD